MTRQEYAMARMNRSRDVPAMKRGKTTRRRKCNAPPGRDGGALRPSLQEPAQLDISPLLRNQHAVDDVDDTV